MNENLEILSEKEVALYNFILKSEDFVTSKLIEEMLGTEYLGAIGKLTRKGFIEKTKKRLTNESNPYEMKIIKGFVIKKEERQWSK